MDQTIEYIKKYGTSVWLAENSNAKDILKQLMKKYSFAYYEGVALISDSDFEVLADTLKIIAPDDEYLTNAGWGYSIENGKPHIYEKIGSLAYYYDYSLLSKVLENQTDLIITPKYDGINYVAYYKSGQLDYCITRGNGYVGKDITKHYIKKLFVVPDCLKDKDFAINGEVIVEKEFNGEVSHRDGVALYVNDGKNGEKYEKFVKFMPFSLINQQFLYKKQLNILSDFCGEKLTEYDFEKLPDEKTLKNLFDNLSKKFPIDGLVIANKDKSLQVAFKFKQGE